MSCRQRESSVSFTRMARLRSKKAFSDQRLGFGRCLPIAIFTLTIVHLLPTTICQDFEDLNKPATTANGNFQSTQNTFQRQPQPNTNIASLSAQQQLLATRQSQASASPSRPMLSSRFSPQGLSAQASSSAPTFANPQAVSATSQKQTPVATSNVEQLMKNAIARSARLESPAESRQDNRAPEVQSSTKPDQLSSLSSASQPQPLATASSSANDRIAESSEVSANTRSAPGGDDSSDERLTTATLATTTNGHETVYTDQRFANLFARRNVGKKTRLAPTEQVKAKPTLPSFIKSLPDPKQFTAPVIQERQPSASFSSARIQLQQQQNQSKNNPPIGQQKKPPAITSNSAANANARRINSLNNNKPSSTVATPKAVAPNARASQSTTSKPIVSNNPFNRQQTNDPANVIALARKRLLANNAIESAKLKQQQQQKPNNE